MLSPTEDDDLDPAVFGPLIDIPEESLVSLALDVRKRILGVSSSHGRLVARIGGSYNIVHIVQLDNVKFVIRVPATGWGSGMTAMAARALESQVATMRLIRRKTTIPVPEIYDLDTTSDNVIGAPYICMGFVPGQTVSKIWTDESDNPLPEEIRFQILSTLSRSMAQLSSLVFDKIGSIMEDDSGALFVGPAFDWKENDDGSISVEDSGPFNSASAYLQHHIDPGDQENVWNRATAKILHVVVPKLLELGSEDGFVLCPPDFDSQNIMVDEQGNVTGVIDWDLAQTMPRCVGYARYPGWITRDWDPLMYGWPTFAHEDSPESLERYRAFYDEELGKALNWQGDWRFTKNSHVKEAVWIAALHHMNRLEICRKLVQVTAGENVNASHYLLDIGEGELGEDEWSALESGLKSMVTAVRSRVTPPLPLFKGGDRVTHK